MLLCCFCFQSECVQGMVPILYLSTGQERQDQGQVKVPNESVSFLFTFKIFIFNCVPPCMCECSARRGHQGPEAGVTDSFEALAMEAGTRTQIL